MPSVFRKALQLLTGVEDQSSLLKLPKKRPFKALTERELIQLESEIGAELFGPIPAGNRREFFCLDAITWIWYEESTDVETGKQKSTTTRYEIHDNGILKAQEGAQYSFLEGDELKNLSLAIQMYYEQVARKIYKRDPRTGQKLA
ncbi:MAG: hypothetical protein JWM00_658 [Candidatus Saccharibacteria bacterium]|nr:hypothetical protein [Candidatus Saccharibacteria bacterium]